MTDVVVTRADREAALRAHLYADPVIRAYSAWIATGGDVFTDEIGEQVGMVPENSTATAIAKARAEGFAAGVKSTTTRLTAVAADLRRLSYEKRGKREIEADEHARMSEALCKLAKDLQCGVRVGASDKEGK